jgi:hypothetical protein
MLLTMDSQNRVDPEIEFLRIVAIVLILAGSSTESLFALYDKLERKPIRTYLLLTLCMRQPCQAAGTAVEGWDEPAADIAVSVGSTN